MAPAQFQMSKKDGKTVLLHSIEKKGFFTLKSSDETIYEDNNNAAKACPVKIISKTDITQRWCKRITLCFINKFIFELRTSERPFLNILLLL